MSLTDSIVEDAALEWLGEPGYAVGCGPQLAPGEPAAERDSFREGVRAGHLIEAIRWLTPDIPEEARATIRQYRIVQFPTGRRTQP